MLLFITVQLLHTYLYYLYYNQQDNLNKLAAFWVNMNEINKQFITMTRLYLQHLW